MMNRIFLIAFLLIVNTAFGLNYNPDGTLTPDIEWYVRDVRADKYLIHNANELAGLEALVNGRTNFSAYDFTGKKVELANDIDMESYVDENGMWHAPVWIPIGVSYSCRFAGEFDGNGHCVKNLSVKGNQMGALFGYNCGAIRNLVIAGGHVSADYYGAGICSYNTGVIEYCINTANIICNNYGGGICGKNYEDGKVRNCINLGYVQDGMLCGGIIGSNSVSSHTEVLNCLYDNQMCPLKRGCGNADNRNAKGLSTSQILAGQGYNADKFVLEFGLYPRLEQSVWTPCLKAMLAPVKLQASETVLNVIKDISLPKIDDVVYHTPSGLGIMTVEGNVCKLSKRASTVLFVSGGGCTRAINIRIMNSTLEFLGTMSRQVPIADYNDLVCFANAVNNGTHYKGLSNISGFADVNFELTGCIRIPDGVNWEPIGTVNSPFNGIFNAQGCVISNINIMRPTQKYCGLFGYCKGRIHKLITVGGDIVGGDYTGGICGYLSGGSIESCLSSVPVKGHYYVGGVLGFCNAGKLSACLHVNTVEGNAEFTGGVCGGAMDGIIRLCSFDNKICIAYPPIGQLDATKVENTFGYRTEALVGSNFMALSAQYQKEFYWDNTMYPQPALNSHHYPEGHVAATPIYIADNEDAHNIKSYILLSDISDISYRCDQTDVLKINPDIAFPLKQGAVIMSVCSGDIRKDVSLRIVNKALDPIGSASSPIMISTYQDFDQLRKAVNYGTSYKGFACIEGFKGVYFKLANDIYCPMGENQIPLGNNLFPFGGVFDGGGKVIRNFECDRGDMDNVGVFGYISGEIRNLRVSQARIRGRYYTGGVAGYNAGVIERCVIDNSSVQGTSYTGGICGFASGNLDKCENRSALVKSDFYSGGIAGSSNGRITTCANSGQISGTSCIGGIAGSNNAPISFCNNTAQIDGDDNVGGISGRNSYSEVIHCSNKGVVTGNDSSGGVVGLNDGTVESCDNDAMVFSKVSAGGIVGRGGRVSKCVNKGSVTADNNNVGGIMGFSKQNSQISRCINYGKVNSHSTAGGICADNKGRITACANFGDVDAQYSVGGIVGSNSGSLSACVMASSVFGNSQMGAICAVEKDQSIVEKCLYDSELCGLKGVGSDASSSSPRYTGVRTFILKDTENTKKLLPVDDFVFQQGQYPLPRTVDDVADSGSGAL